MRLRVLFISNYYPPLELGGWEQLTRDVALQFQARGHQVWVLTSNFESTRIVAPEPGVTRALHLQSPDHLHYHTRYTLSYRCRTRRNWQHLSRIVSCFAPDVVFINGMWNLSRGVAWQAERLCPHRVVYYIASPWPTDLDPHESYWMMPAGRLWLRPAKKALARLVSKTLVHEIRSNQLAFAHVLCVSGFMQRYMVDEVGVPVAQTRVVYNGVDVNMFSLTDRIFQRQATLQLLYAGGLLEHKGVHTAIQAVDHLVKQRNTRNIHLTLVGSGHPAYVQSLRDQARTQGIAHFVTFAERVPRDSMPGLLRHYDTLVFPSTGPEALARIIQEAMASGLVVIGTTTGGSPEILSDGRNGLTFRAGDAIHLADKINQVAGDSLLRERLARNARRTVQERFTIDRMVDELEDYLLCVGDGRLV